MKGRLEQSDQCHSRPFHELNGKRKRAVAFCQDGLLLIQDKNEVRAGRVTPQSYIAARGGDWRNDLQDFKTFFDKAHELGVVLDIDVALVDQHGRQPPKPPKEGDDGSDTEDKTLDDAEDDKDDKGDD